MASDLDIQRHIDNAEYLKTQIEGEVTQIIADYIAVNDKWNTYLDDYLNANGGALAGTPSEQDKIDALTERLYYSDEASQSKFLNSLKSSVQERDNSRAQLQKQAQEVLQKEKELIEKNKTIIESLRDALQNDEKRQEELAQEIEILNNEIEANEEKIDERNARIGVLQAELADPAISDADKKAKNIELKNLRREIKDFTDKNSDLSSKAKSKTAEKDKIDINARKTKIDELNDKNKELEENLEINTRSFKSLNIEVNAPAGNADPQTQAQQGPAQDSNNAQAKGVAGVAAPAAAQTQTSMVKLSDREIANNMAREFRNARTTAEQRKVIDGYGYSDIASMMEYLGPIQKRKLRNVLREELNSKDIPADLNMLNGIPGIDTSALYDALFRDSTTRDMKSLSVDDLRTIQNAFDTFESQKSELVRNGTLSVAELKQLEDDFDKNVAHFVKYGALIDKGTIGGRMGAFFNIGGRKVVRNKLVNSMKDYTMGRQEEKAKKTMFANDIRTVLGQEVVEVPDVANQDRNRDTAYTNPMQDRSKSGKGSTSKER